MPAEAASTSTPTVELAGCRISNALFAAVFDAGPAETPDVFAQAVDELGQTQAREFARVLGRNDPAWRDALAADEPKAGTTTSAARTKARMVMIIFPLNAGVRPGL